LIWSPRTLELTIHPTLLNLSRGSCDKFRSWQHGLLSIRSVIVFWFSRILWSSFWLSLWHVWEYDWSIDVSADSDQAQ
jgi:hypothetical protein